MLRVESEEGWWLVTHPDHARLAAEFARHWGNAVFAPPEPRDRVLYGIGVHDDGWISRDQNPMVTREGKPSAFSHELVGKYSAFEEIDLADYLAVRERAVQKLETVDPYAALLVSMHTHNLLSERADRSTITPEQLPLLDDFLDRQRTRLKCLRNEVRRDSRLPPRTVSDQNIEDNFRLLQAMDNLSLLSCVGYMQPATLLHPMRRNDGGSSPVKVNPIAPRVFRVDPYPFDVPKFTVQVLARHVNGKIFSTSEALNKAYAATEPQLLIITVKATA